MQYSERIFCKFNSILKLYRNHADEISLNTHTEHFKNTTICFNWKELRRILGRDPWIVFRNDVVPPSWTLILPESWDESKSVFKGKVDGFKIGEGEGRGGKNPLPLSLFRCFSRWRPRSMYLLVFVKKRLLCRLSQKVSHKQNQCRNHKAALNEKPTDSPQWFFIGSSI